jgi:hypothetical protein
VDNDSDFTRQNGGYHEYTETFSMAITQASSCDSIQVESSARTISILDKTQYESFSPIALDLNGDGRIGVTGESTVKDADRNAIGRTVSFDINADGELDQIEWFSGDGDGILVNTAYIGANGEIDGSALFGDEGGKYANGYEKLSALDANGDGVLSDLEMAELALWLDDGDAVLEERELHSLREFNISSLLVGMNLDDEGRMRSIAQLTDGSQILTEDVWFAGL